MRTAAPILLSPEERSALAMWAHGRSFPWRLVQRAWMVQMAAIKQYVENHNQNPQVFVWTASVERILTQVAKCKEALDSLH